MKEKYYIKHYCRIRSSEIKVDGETVFRADEAFKEFSKSAYRAFEIAYPKFFKMDNLSKLAFLEASLLLKDYTEGENDIALVFGNASSSLDTDLIYQQSIENKEEYYPSPAVFVYTLPNICLGEISIKFKLYSENSFFVTESYNPHFFGDYAELLLNSKKANEVLCGWVEIMGDYYNAFFYLVSEEGTLEHNTQNLNFLFRE